VSTNWFSPNDWARVLVQCGVESKESVVRAASLSNYSASRSTVLQRFSRRADA
jgi:hypothetical protein